MAAEPAPRRPLLGRELVEEMAYAVRHAGREVSGALNDGGGLVRRGHDIENDESADEGNDGCFNHLRFLLGQVRGIRARLIAHLVCSYSTTRWIVVSRAANIGTKVWNLERTNVLNCHVDWRAFHRLVRLTEPVNGFRTSQRGNCD